VQASGAGLHEPRGLHHRKAAVSYQWHRKARGATSTAPEMSLAGQRGMNEASSGLAKAL